MVTKTPSMSATDGALSYTTMTDMDAALADPAWNPVGLVTNWKIDPAKQHQLLYYGGNRRLANDKKTGEAYELSFSIDLESTNGLPLYDRASKDIAGAGTANEYLAFACRVKYDNVDQYVLVLGAFINEVKLNIGMDVLSAEFTVTILKSFDIFDLTDFMAATGVTDPDTPTFNAPPSPDPITHLSPGPGVVPCSINSSPQKIISMTITHSNAVQPVKCTNDMIASGGAIGHQSVKLSITIYEDDTAMLYNMKNDTMLNIEYKITTTKKLVMNGFKINGHPLSHDQKSDDLGTIELSLDGPSALLATYP